MESRGGNFGGLSLDLSLTPDDPLDPEPCKNYLTPLWEKYFIVTCYAVRILVRNRNARSVANVHRPLVLD